MWSNAQLVKSTCLLLLLPMGHGHFWISSLFHLYGWYIAGTSAIHTPIGLLCYGTGCTTLLYNCAFSQFLQVCRKRPYMCHTGFSATFPPVLFCTLQFKSALNPQLKLYAECVYLWCFGCTLQSFSTGIKDFILITWGSLFFFESKD